MNKGMKWYCIFIFLLIAIGTNAQKFEQKIETTGNRYNVIYNGKSFVVDTSTFVVKVDDEKYLKENYDVIRYNKLGYADVRKPKDVSLESFANRIISDNKIIEACYNTFGEYCSFTPNDAYEQTQWALNAINVRSAWDFTKGSPNVIVGVLDSGLEWTHQDIGLGYNSYQNVYLNSGEDAWTNANTPSTGNHLDDDGNGHIDDWKGWNFASNSNDVRTNNGHGTKVTGIIAAKTNNNIGIAGICGGNGGGSKIIFCATGEQVPDASLVDDAIIYAVDIGAKVINMSFGVNSTPAIESAIQYAINNNVVLIASSGNDGIDDVLYPASNTNVMAVGASNMNNQWLSLSNFGNEMSVVAPGINVLTTTLNNSYVTDGGTSIAAPHVSGVAALMFSANPNLTATQVKTIIEQTAQRVHNNDGYVYTNNPLAHPNGDWNIKMGYGLVDAHKAVMEAYFYNHAIEGDYQLSSCGEYGYSVSEEVPDCTSLTWELSNNLEEVSRQGTEIIVRPIGYGAGWIKASFEHECYTITRTKNVNVASGYITYYNNYTVNPNSTMSIASSVVIAGNFTISSGSTVTVSSTVRCSPDAKIVIQPNGKLIVNGGTITNLCTGKMWNGIYVVGNKNQRQLASYQGTLVVKNNSIIENAKCAIRNWDGSNTNTAGGIVNVSSGSTLRNNTIAAEFMPYTNHDSNGALTADNSYFTTSNFLINNSNILSDNGQTFENFVYLSGVYGISFRGCDFADRRSAANAQAKGINAMASQFSVDEYCPSGVYGLYTCQCSLTPTRSNFHRLGRAIKVNNNGSTYTFTVRRTDFDTCYRAVDIYATNSFQVTESDFDLNIYPTFDFGTSAGVNIQNSTGYKVEGNSFYTGYQSYPISTIDRGVYVYKSGTDVNTIYRNYFDKMYYGVLTDGNNSGLQIQCNEFTNGRKSDIVAWNYIASSQGSSTQSAGNKFTSSIPSYNCQTTYNTTYYYSGTYNSTNPYCPQQVNSHVTSVANASANSCASTLCFNGGGIIPMFGQGSDDITAYDSLQQLYDSQMAEYTAAGYGFLLENFEEEDADIVALARLKQDTLVSISRAMAEIANRNINAIFEDTLVFDRDALNGWYSRINTQSAKYSLVNSYFEVGEYALARQELAAIPQRFALTTDELDEYDNFCQYHSLREAVYTDERNYAQLTEGEIAELQAIADRNTGVSSAYASSVLCFFYGICRDEELNINFDIDAPMNSKSTAAVSDESTDAEPLAIYVYPNPANDELNVLLNALPEGRTVVEFHDITGRLMLMQEITSTNARIDISSLPQGVYMCRIVNGDNIIARDRIVKE